MAMYNVLTDNCCLTETDAAMLDGGKRKREGEDDMAALEVAVAGTRLQGFVSGGTVQPDQRTQEEAAAAAAGAHKTAVSSPACSSVKVLCMLQSWAHSSMSRSILILR